MAKISNRQRLSKLDFHTQCSFHQIKLDKSAQEIGTINTHIGLFKVIRLPFGIASSPAIFQRQIKDKEEHLRILDQVLQNSEGVELKLSRDKCKFQKESVEYLGHTIAWSGIQLQQAKLEAIANAPEPMDVKYLRLFIGIINYYSRFLQNMSQTLHPLLSLLKKIQRWK
ncbi:K02A2.6-like [Cordylochernes scorpioides]|uniref:K02A2.6-like n=1 Tax=Cordylochernes scorpioides TaxID=51811 RepID=A0ABY6LRQ4_9ARAC|nr:K02A2.6-like [Cordylochernes scorpioides]